MGCVFQSFYFLVFSFFVRSFFFFSFSSFFLCVGLGGLSHGLL